MTAQHANFLSNELGQIDYMEHLFIFQCLGMLLRCPLAMPAMFSKLSSITWLSGDVVPVGLNLKMRKIVPSLCTRLPLLST